MNKEMIDKVESEIYYGEREIKYMFEILTGINENDFEPSGGGGDNDIDVFYDIPNEGQFDNLIPNGKTPKSFDVMLEGKVIDDENIHFQLLVNFFYGDKSEDKYDTVKIPRAKFNYNVDTNKSHLIRA